MSDEKDEMLDFSFDEIVAQLEPEEDGVVEKKSDETIVERKIEKTGDESEEIKAEEITAKEEIDETKESVEVEENVVEIADDASIEDGVSEQTVEAVEVSEFSDNLEKNEENKAAGSEIDFNPLDPDSVGRFLEDMGVAPDIIESKKCLINVMQRENELLDKILETQTELHNFVREKNWDSLTERLESLQCLSDTFAELEEERETLCELIDMRTDEEISPVLTQVRGKLQRSKIENHALNEYISTTRKFLQGVFDSVVPQRRNTVYSKTGKIVRPELSGVAVNISL